MTEIENHYGIFTRTGLTAFYGKDMEYIIFTFILNSCKVRDF